MNILKLPIKFWPSWNPFKLLLLGALYAIAYDYVYREFVDYFFPLRSEAYHVISGLVYYFYVFLSSLPFIFYRGLKTVAVSFSLFTYILVYIPVINALWCYSFSYDVQIEYSIVFFICMCMFFYTDRIYILKSLFKRKSGLIPFKYLEYAVLFCMIVLVLLNRSQLTFVNFLQDSAELYDARAEMNVKGIYLVCWMRSCFLPLIMVSALRNKNYRKYFLVLFAFLLIFMLDKQKLTAVFPLVVTGLYYVANTTNKFFSTYFHSIIIIFIAVVSLAIVTYVINTGTTLSTNPVLFALAALFVMRTQCIEGMETVRYFSFFIKDDNPFTYYSHVNLINAVTHSYPYKESIGATVAGDGGVSNATFWLMDGVAAWGMAGVIIISLLFVIFKSIMNSADARCSVPMYVCISLQGIMSMINLSLFTSINTCGLLMLYLVLLFVKTDLAPVPNKQYHISKSIR